MPESISLQVDVVCGKCYDLDEKGEDDAEAPMMELKGNLYFNPVTKSQSQAYKCEECGNEIAITISPKR